MSNSRSSRGQETSASFGLSPEQLQAHAALELRRRQQSRAKKLKSTITGWSKDFPGFARLLKVASKNANAEDGLINVQQSPILKAFEDRRTGRDYVLKARQVYMTTWELARDIWFFLTKRGVQVHIVCQSDKENTAVKQISNRLTTMFESLKAACPDAPFVKHSDIRWGRTDGGKSELWIIGAGATEKSASKKGRSGTIHRLHITEVAFFEYADETLTAMLQCVGGVEFGTEITFESTPNGARGYFYENYLKSRTGENGFKVHFFPWFMQPEYRIRLEKDEVVEARNERERELVNAYGVKPTQLKWYRQKVADAGQAKTDQEYPTDDRTCWLYEGRLFFDKDALSRLRQKVREPLELETRLQLGGSFKQWFRPQPGRSYIIGVDPSNGVGGDPVAGVVLDKESGEHCATLCGQFTADNFASIIAAIGWAYNRAMIAIERSASCDLIFSTLAKWKRPGEDTIGYPNLYVGEGKKLGFWMTHTSRPRVLDALEEAIRKSFIPMRDKDGNEVFRGFRTYDLELIQEAQDFIVVDDKPQAAPGAHDDRIMAMAIAYSLSGLQEGLKHTAFAPPPSISYTHTPAAFEGIQTSGSIDEIVQREKARWAGGTVGADAGLGLAAIISSPADLEGF